MFIIIEHNGPDYITLVLNKRGEVRKFCTYNHAVKWAKKNIAFKYRVVDLNKQEI